MHDIAFTNGRGPRLHHTAFWVPTPLNIIDLLDLMATTGWLSNLDAIASTDGVDGVFIGPADLAADMGFLSRPGAPEVQQAVEQALIRIQQHGKAAGILTADPTLARRYLELGATFVAIGSDVGVVTNATAKLLADFKSAAPSANPAQSTGQVY